MEHICKKTSGLGREIDVYDETGKRWPIFECVQDGKTLYRVASGIAVQARGDGSFLVAFGKSIIVRLRSGDGGR